MLIYYLASYSDLVPCHVFNSSSDLLTAAILIVRISNMKQTLMAVNCSEFFTTKKY